MPPILIVIINNYNCLEFNISNLVLMVCVSTLSLHMLK